MCVSERLHECSPWYTLNTMTSSQDRRFIICLVYAALLCVVGAHSLTITAYPFSPSQASTLTLIYALHTVPARVEVAGYSRPCAAGMGCSFGPAWSAQFPTTDGQLCSTRETALITVFRSENSLGYPQIVPTGGANSLPGCRPPPGRIIDPYTGGVLPSQPSRAVHVDHVYALSAAWDMGAWAWSASMREKFANDLENNLIVTSAWANTLKSDDTPQDWMPPNTAFHCIYASKYARVAALYGLSISSADKRALITAARTCPQ